MPCKKVSFYTKNLLKAFSNLVAKIETFLDCFPSLCPLAFSILQKCQSEDHPEDKQKESFRHFVYYQGTPKKEISDAFFPTDLSPHV